MWSGISQGLVSQDKETLVKTLASDEVDFNTLKNQWSGKAEKKAALHIFN